ncbi:hypothetical protein [Streptomyces sp. NPDC052015]
MTTPQQVKALLESDADLGRRIRCRRLEQVGFRALPLAVLREHDLLTVG